MNRPAEFGETLRRHRERRGVSLDTIARDTKISKSVLAALERGDCSRWPRGVYSRAYVRSYAGAVGLDPNQVTEEFCRYFAEVARSDHDPPPPAAKRGVDPAVAAEPLRLSLDPPETESWSPFASRLASAVPDCVASLTLAGIARLLGADFWVSLSLASVAIHALMPADVWRSVPRRVFALRRRPEPARGATHDAPETPVMSSLPYLAGSTLDS